MDRENQTLTSEEQVYFKECSDALTVYQRDELTKLDLIQIVRGYSYSKNRSEDTIKAAREIANFRLHIGYNRLVCTRISNSQGHLIDEQFHKAWAGKIYGQDIYGHFLSVIKLEDINFEELVKFDKQDKTKLFTQILIAYSAHCKLLSEQQGTQIYKYSLVIDCHNIGRKLLSKEYMLHVKQIIDIGSEYFPESLFKIYIIRPSFMFKLAWNIIKHWIHPVTCSKINMISDLSNVNATLIKDGFTKESIPDYIGGTSIETTAFQLVLSMIINNTLSDKKVDNVLHLLNKTP